jgi:hypothetical protein
MGTAKLAEIDREDEHEQEASTWMRAHQALSRLARERAAADAEEGRWLLAALRSATHAHLGFGSFSEYIERSFGYKPRSTQEKLRVAEALEEPPLLTRALEQGTVRWSAVRELTRAAVPENEREWLAMAEGKSVRQLEKLVAGKSPGDDPSSWPTATGSTWGASCRTPPTTAPRWGRRRRATAPTWRRTARCRRQRPDGFDRRQ